MPDEQSPVQHTLMLHRTDPEQRVARFYALIIERDLFGTVVLVRNWGRIGTHGREMVEEYPTEIEAGTAIAPLARAKRRPSRRAKELRQGVFTCR